MASLIALVDPMTRNSVDLLAYLSSTENMSHAKSDRLSSPSTLLSMLSVIIFYFGFQLFIPDDESYHDVVKSENRPSNYVYRYVSKRVTLECEG